MCLETFQQYAAWFESKFVRGVAFQKQVPLFNKP